MWTVSCSRCSFRRTRTFSFWKTNVYKKKYRCGEGEREEFRDVSISALLSLPCLGSWFRCVGPGKISLLYIFMWVTRVFTQRPHRWTETLRVKRYVTPSVSGFRTFKSNSSSSCVHSDRTKTCCSCCLLLFPDVVNFWWRNKQSEKWLCAVTVKRLPVFTLCFSAVETSDQWGERMFLRGWKVCSGALGFFCFCEAVWSNTNELRGENDPDILLQTDKVISPSVP